MTNIMFLEKIGYSPKNGTSDTYSKIYIDQCIEIEIDLIKNKIHYPNIKDNINGFNIDRETSSNLNIEENYSVLECINTLLSIGYKPKDMIIEKAFSSGRSDAFLDILVKYPNDYHIIEKQSKTYMMIEVKSNEEYEKTLKDSIKVKNNGEPKSQLLSYFQQDKNTEFILYYTSYNNGKVIRKYSFIDILEEKLNESNNLKEIYNNWNKVFYTDKGIFENELPYNNKIIPLQKCLLKDLETEEDSRKIFYQFLTILRQYAISDKANAFNKIFNLFICKVKDEDSKDSEDILDFQWKNNDSYETLLNRLNDLYKHGIKEYLDISIVDTNEDDFNKLINKIDSNKQLEIKKIYNQLRLYKNNEFAFLEVFDEDTFNKNAEIIKKIVQLLEKYKLRYTHKQQFLGDFFEYLLNTGLKQENGQFFTPIPIAKFIISSLPIKKIILKKIENNPHRLQNNLYEILPYSIDYAAGSGHFLTEIMDELNTVLHKIKGSKDFLNYKKVIQKTIVSYTDEENLYNWANEYIYGIEKDYRLAKTAKVSCFLNGDGDANMIYADGLDNFNNSLSYKGILKTNNQEKDNNVFDVIVANPPYSVSGFKNFLKDGKKSFELFDLLGDDSDDIECLFIERTKQLLKTNGVAGIVLPTSILSNGGIFTHTRSLLLKNFKFKSIVDMTSKGKVFAKTGVNAVILFLEKRDQEEYNIIEAQVEEFFKIKSNIVINGIQNLVKFYCEDIYGLKIEEYLDLINGEIFKEDCVNEFYKNENFIKNTEVYIEYYENYLNTFKNNKNIFDNKKLNKCNLINFKEYVKTLEIEKITIFALNYNEKCLSITFPQESNELKQFLGYEFSERGGNEGIQLLKDDNNLFESFLFDELDHDKENSNKLNYYINAHMSNKDFEIKEDLKKFISLISFNHTLDLNKIEWIKEININKKNPKFYEGSKWDYEKLDEKIVDIFSGSTFDKKYQGNKNDKLIPYYKVSDMNKNENLVNMTISENYVEENIAKEINASILKPGTVIFPKVGMSIYTNKKRILTKNSCVDNNIFAITVKEKILSKYLYYLFKEYLYLPNISSKSSPPSMNKESVTELKIPIPPMHVQEAIIKDISIIENKIIELETLNSNNINEMKSLLSDIDKLGIEYKINDCCEPFSIGSTPSRSEPKYYLNGTNLWLSIGDMNTKYINKTKEKLTDKAVLELNLNKKLAKKGSVLMSFKLTIGKIAIAQEDMFTNEAIATLNAKNHIMTNDFLYYSLMQKFNNSDEGSIKSFGKSLNMDSIGELKIRIIMDVKVQQQYIVKFNAVELKIKNIKDEIENMKDTKSIFDRYLK